MDSSTLAALSTVIGICSYAGIRMAIGAYIKWRDKRETERWANRFKG